MKSRFLGEQGQALILITLAAVGMFAMVGLAIDGAAKFSDQRHAQSAADTSALAGALSLVNGETTYVGGVPVWKLKALDRAKDNGYTGDLVNSTVEVYKCNEDDASCGPYDGLDGYVQVVINSYINTTFSRVIGIRQLHNRVEAVTKWTPNGPTYGPELLKSLSPEACNGDNGNIVFGGNGDVTLTGGGAYINSGGGGCGMELTGCGNLTVTGGSLSSIGSGNINIETSSETCAENLDIPEPSYNYNEGVGFPFPPEMPERPKECDSAYLLGSWSNNTATNTSTMNPGWYSEFPPAHNIQDIIVMNPGVYCVDDLVKLSGRNLNLYGVNVLLYIRSGGQFDVQGGAIHLEGRYPGYSYAGYLIIINSDFTGTVPNCTINGNSHNIYKGTVFAPYCDFTFNGTNETGDPDLNYNIQVVAYTISLAGNSNINFVYKVDDVAQSDPEVGLMR